MINDWFYKKLILSALVAIALFVSSCSKEGDGGGGGKYYDVTDPQNKKRTIACCEEGATFD